MSAYKYNKVYVFMQGFLPFAIIGSMEEVKVGNKVVKARQYPWGTVQGEEMLLESIVI